MKKLLTIGLLLAACGACDPRSPYEKDMDRLEMGKDYLNKYLSCAWIEKYGSCFCFIRPRYEDSLLIYVPDKACGR